MVPIDRLLAGAASHRQEKGRPLVTLSYAQSLDGSLAARRGTPLHLSGEASLRLTHRLRAAHDAILVGINTILSDDPQLTVRLVEGPQPQPIVLDSHLRITPHVRLFNGPRLPWIATLPNPDAERRARLIEAGAQVIICTGDDGGQVSPENVLTTIATLGINSLMVEGGAAVITSFLTARLADLLVLTISPLFIGGLHAPESLVADPSSAHHGWPRLTNPGSEHLGQDLILWGNICYD